MFKRIIFENWTGFVPMLSFWLTFCVFIAISIRTLLLRKQTVRDMANMPLRDDNEHPLSENQQ
ncbi:hypothetical protein [Coraliomargarita parva]|uniref:hypothetical protein n=1 Tax=Coraliomargarita parva TaxID=3014050 RepID=UPI0022B4FCAF|nr:hypothetical protein [Coraliomargarita parva]